MRVEEEEEEGEEEEEEEEEEEPLYSALSHFHFAVQEGNHSQVSALHNSPTASLLLLQTD